MKSVGICNGVFALTMNKENTKTFTLDGEIPKQTLTLKNVKIRHTTNEEYFRIELPFLSSSSIMNANNHSRLCIPAYVGQGIFFRADWDLDMKTNIDSAFTVKIYKSDGTLVDADQITNLTLIFQFRYGAF